MFPKNGWAQLNTPNFGTVQDLYFACEGLINTNGNGGEQGLLNGVGCAAYMQGFIHGSSVVQYVDKTHVTCIPSMSNFQMAKIFIKFVDDNPKFLNQPLEPIYGGFVAGVFPCEKKP